MAEDIYAQLASEQPDRGNEIESNDDDISKVPPSASENEAFSPNDSDLESTLKRLFPSFADDDIKEIKTFAQIIMLGDVFPDNFSTKVYLLVTSLALKHYNDPNFDVVMTMMKIEGICQVGLLRKGRAEAVIVSGNVKEISDQENMNRLGMP